MLILHTLRYVQQVFTVLLALHFEQKLVPEAHQLRPRQGYSEMLGATLRAWPADLYMRLLFVLLLTRLLG
jgi:hypothetical protein